jgi:hypothetical protein
MQLNNRTNQLVLLSLLIIVFAGLHGYIGFSKQLIFGWDQARDAYEAHSIWYQKDIKIQGPSSDIPGVHHGALWYYALALPYAIGQGNPETAGFIFLVLSLLTIPLIGYLSYELFGAKKIAITAMIIYSFAPLFQAFTRWLSNPLLSLYVTPILLLTLWRYIKRQHARDALFTGITMGMLIQSNFAYGIFLLTLPLYFLYFKVKVKLKDIGLFLLGITLSSATYILAEVRFGGKTTRSMIAYLQESASSGEGVSGSIIALVDRTIDLIYFTVLPLPKLAVFVVVIFTIYYLVRTHKSIKDISPFIFLLIWLTTIYFFMFFKAGILQSGHIYGPSIAAITIATAALVSQLRGKTFFVILSLLAFSQILKNTQWIYTAYTPLSIQRDINYYDEKQIVDYTYEAAGRKPFTITTITNPLFINTTWAYLYEFYGKEKYKYVPYWHGRSQEGYLGNLPEKQFATQTRFLILEPKQGIQDFFIKNVMHDEGLISRVDEERQIGKFTVQKRTLTTSDAAPNSSKSTIFR